MSSIVTDGWIVTCPHCNFTGCCKIVVEIWGVDNKYKEVAVDGSVHCYNCDALLVDNTTYIELEDD